MTSRSTSGFGSTDERPTNPPSPLPTINSSTPNINVGSIPDYVEELVTRTINKITSDLNVSIEIPSNIHMSHDLFDNYTQRKYK